MNLADDALARVFRLGETSPEPAASGVAAPARYSLGASGFQTPRRNAVSAFVAKLMLAIIGCIIAASCLAAPAQIGTRNVLFISSERSDMPAMRELEETMRSVFHESHDPEIDFFPEYLDFARFPVEKYGDPDVKYLRERYAGQQIDLIMVSTGFALEFVLSRRDEIFPRVPIVFCAAADREIQIPHLPPDVTGVAGHFDLKRTLDLIFALQPNVTQIVVVGGTSSFDRFWEEQTRKLLKEYLNKTEFRWLTDLSLAQTADEVSKLPPSAAVFYISMLRDGEGHTMTATDAVRDLCRVSKAPIYGITSHFLDAGAVGGAVFDFAANGRKAADLVLKVLRGDWVAAGSPELEIQNPLAVNREALQKWNLSESRVPPGAEIRHMSPSLWEMHRTLILWTIFVVLIQSALIIGWLAQRLWRRRAESSLFESEERFRTMADAAPVLIWMSGPDRLCTFCNTAWLAFTGRKMEQELGNGWAESVHQDDLEKCVSTYVAAFDSRKPFTMGFRVKRHDGEYRFLTDKGVPRFGRRGNFRGYIGACVDISDSLQQQKALHEFEERVTLAAEAAQLGVWELNTATNNLWVSDKARELFQFSATGEIRFSDFADRIYPQDRGARSAAIKQAIATGGGYEIEYRILLQDGTVRWFHGRGQCVADAKGVRSRLIGVSMDVTERKEAQELFQQVTEASPSGTILVDRKGKIVLVNAQTEKLFDFWRDELVGRSIDVLMPDRFASEFPALREAFLVAPETMVLGTGRELFGRCKDGSEIPVEIGLNPVQTPRGLLVLITVTDISARKAAAEQARKSREEIDRLTRISLLGEMTASIAHELNQPLSAIANNASAAQRFLGQGKLDPDTIREILEDVGADARRAHNIISHIRNTIKKGAAIRERINLNEVVNRVTHSIRPDARIYSCEIDTALDQSLPEVEGDPVQIQQVLINLVSNAFDAMGEIPIKQRRVRIRTERRLDGTVSVSVRDHGVGIREAAQEKLFDQFFTTKSDGLGMGLAIVRSIIENHGGHISAENVQGGGARFRFSLPVAPAVDSSPAPESRRVS